MESARPVPIDADFSTLSLVTALMPYSAFRGFRFICEGLAPVAFSAAFAVASVVVRKPCTATCGWMHEAVSTVVLGRLVSILTPAAKRRSSTTCEGRARSLFQRFLCFLRA